MSKHTPGPWKVFEFGGVQIGQAETADAICSMWGDADEGKANAAVIVRAVNHHDKLAEALKALLKIVEDARADEAFDASTCDAGGVIFGDIASEAIETSRAALASLDQESGQ